MDARKDARRMNLDSRGREAIPASFSSEGTTVFVVVCGLSRRFGDGSFAFSQSVVFWKRGWRASRAREREGLNKRLRRMWVSSEGDWKGSS